MTVARGPVDRGSDGEIRGSCFCGAVAYAFTATHGIFQYCHCSRCRKFTGSALAANILVPPAAFAWTRGAEHVGRYEPADTRHFATAFCRRCGSSLPWHAKTGRSVVVPAGTLDDDPGIAPSQNVFRASGALWFRDPADLPSHDTLPARRR